MREMKDSGVEWIGEVPKSWNIFRNKNAFTCNKDIVGEQSSEVQLLSLTTKGIKKKNINNTEGKLPETFDTYQLVRKNNLVMCLFDLDMSAVFSGISPYSGMISPAYRVLSCNDLMYPQYADYWFQYISHGRKFNHYAKNIRNTLNIDEFFVLPMLFPSVNEQRKIADYLNDKCSKIDAIIAKQEKIIEKLKEYKTSAITEFVLKGTHDTVSTVTSGFPWIPMYNEIYKLVKIGQFCFVTKLAGFEYTNTMVSNITDDAEVPIVRAQNVRMLNFNDDITEFIDMRVSQQLSRCALDKKALLITFIGAGIGDVCVFDREQRYHLAPNVAKIEIRKQYKNILSEEYLMYYLASYAGKGEISKISKASAQPSLSMGTIRGITFTLPPIDEQKEIVTHLNTVCESIDKQVTRRAQLISKLTEYKKSLIYECVTGKKEIT